MANAFAIAVAAGLANVHAGRRGQNKRRESFTSDEDLSVSIRLTAAQVRLVAAEYNQWRAQRNALRPNSAMSFQRMSEFLTYLARGGYFHQVAMAGGIAKSTMIMHVREVAEFFAATASQYIALPLPNEFVQLSSPLHYPGNPNMYKVILYIDGFIVKIQRPDHAGDAYFCGRHGKSCDSINVQYITDCFGRIRHVITGLSGATHDKTAAAWSAEFMAFLNQLPVGYVVLGDPAYRGLHPNVITTFTGAHLTQQQLNFNNDCTRLRQIVERTIGAAQLKWRVQQLKDNRLAAKKGVLFAAQCTLAAAVLHNRFTNFL